MKGISKFDELIKLMGRNNHSLNMEHKEIKLFAFFAVTQKYFIAIRLRRAARRVLEDGKNQLRHLNKQNLTFWLGHFKWQITTVSGVERGLRARLWNGWGINSKNNFYEFVWLKTLPLPELQTVCRSSDCAIERKVIFFSSRKSSGSWCS